VLLNWYVGETSWADFVWHCDWEAALDQKDKLIIDTVLELFSAHGSTFNMDDVAKALKISKKTIYKEYGSKENLIFLVVKSVFEGIEHQLQAILANTEWNSVEKLIRVTCAFPDERDIDYHKALILKKESPQAYAMFIHYIENNWQVNKKLFEQAVQEGLIKDIGHDLFRIIMLGISKQVLDVEEENKEELLEKCVRQVFEGLVLQKNEIPSDFG
jgi:AcrR family transcriptional regulator